MCDPVYTVSRAFPQWLYGGYELFTPNLAPFMPLAPSPNVVYNNLHLAKDVRSSGHREPVSLALGGAYIS